MKKRKQRVIAIDYFRGICILAVILNHAAAFSLPFAYFSGNGVLWTSAAEMFLLLSGITFAIVRGDMVRSRFRYVLERTWRRAGIIYLVNISVIIVSLLMALYITSRGLPNDVAGPLPTVSGWSLVFQIFTYKYSIGWGIFLLYYSLLLLAAPFIMYLIRSRYWIVAPVLSVALFMVDRHPGNILASAGVWQIYFVMGLSAANFRQQIKSMLSLSIAGRLLQWVLLPATFAALALNILLNYPIGSYIVRLTNNGWLPEKFESAYLHLVNHLPAFNYWFMNTRTGLLRPVMAAMVAASAYVLYSRYEERLLRRTGSFILIMGRNTMAVFSAQAIVIPVLAALNLPHNLVNASLLTTFLFGCMWVVAKTDISRVRISDYMQELRASYLAAKNTYSQNLED